MVSMLTMAQSNEIVFAPQWTAQAQFAGYYAAQAKGFYKEAGLNVRIMHPSASNSSANLMRDGKADFITLHLISAMKNIAMGLPLINLLQTSQNNSQMIISHKPIKDPSSLKGMRMGRWKVGYVELGLLIDKIYDLNIEWIPYIQNVNLFISGAIDATMAMTYNEYYQLLMAGQNIEKNQILYFRDIGYNIPEDGLYVSADYYRKHPKEAKLFAEASKKGWEWVAQHPEEALDIVMEVTKVNHVKTNRAAQRWMLNEILNVMKDPKSGQRTYQLNKASMQHANNVLLQNKSIKEAITYQKITQP
jgi:NitT/TauT family transport system substrate-binding protein